jgi:hypothetical protein
LKQHARHIFRLFTSLAANVILTEDYPMRRVPAQRLLPSLAAALLIILLVPCALTAQEIIVKNDSITDFGTAVVVGDFVAGEKTGAVLTMPQAGTIVGIQIYWRSQSGGAGMSFESAIHISEGNSFPAAGTLLETIPAPVLQDGWLNEFRYLDDDSTIPLSVPVSAGQNVMVTLQFANATNIAAGSASVVRDISGCQSGRNTLYAIPGGWLNFCLFLSGDLAVRAVLDTTPPASTVTCSLTCTPPGGTVPFVTNMAVQINNTYTGLTRRMAGKINMTLANGTYYGNWRAGFTNVGPGASFATAWNQSIPALGVLIGTNMFSLICADVTPAPYNQPPHPMSGDTANDVCSVVGIAP